MHDYAQLVEASAAETSSDAQSQAAQLAIDRKLHKYSWYDLAAGIILAGGLYPFLLTGLVALISVISFLLGSSLGRPFLQDWSDLGEFIGAAFLVAVAGGCAGINWTMLVAAVTAPVVYLFVRTLQHDGRILLVGAVWGGLVGFVAVIPFTLPIVEEMSSPGTVFGMFLAVVLGPGLATIVGQVGGVWGAQRAIIGRQQAMSRDACSGQEVGTLPLQFGLRQLMWFTLWLSLLLATIRLSGIPFEFVLPTVFGWLAFQTATICFGRWLARRLEPWFSRQRAKGNWPVLWPR